MSEPSACGHDDCEAVSQATQWFVDRALAGDVPGLEYAKKVLVEEVRSKMGYDGPVDDRMLEVTAIAALAGQIADACLDLVVKQMAQNTVMNQFANPN